MSKGMDVSKLNEFLAGGKRDNDVPVVAQDKRCDCGCCQDSAGSESGIAAPAVALTDAGGKVSSKKCAGKAKKYLDMVNSKDAAVDLTKLALSGWKNPVSPSLRPIQQPKAKTPLFQKEKTLEEHDKRWHGGHYDGGACKYREEHGIETTKKGVDTGAKADDLKGSEEGANKGHGAHPRKMYPYVKKQFPGDKIEKSLADLVQKHVNSDFDYDVKNAFPNGVPEDKEGQVYGLVDYYQGLLARDGIKGSPIEQTYKELSSDLLSDYYSKLSPGELADEIHSEGNNVYGEYYYRDMNEDDFWDNIENARDESVYLDAMMTEYEKKMKELFSKHDLEGIIGKSRDIDDIVGVYPRNYYPYISVITGKKYSNKKQPGLYNEDIKWFNDENDWIRYRNDQSEAYEKKESTVRPLWEGNLSDKDNDEVEAIGNKVFEDLGDDIYAAMGDDGRYVFQNGKTIREVSSKDMFSDDQVKETILESLPDDSKGFDKSAFVKNIASKMNQFVKDYSTWESTAGMGSEYDDDVD